ncbi:restriction endonuclease subunit S [Mycoplasma sp. 31_09]|uniref:restriction endonuclease subunit S n=1 Tax=Mycoplasma sp. 31_09 TaxID=3401663 RepID=UPI003AADA937
MKKEKMVPKIRFKGFKEEWNQKVINQTLIPVISTLTMSNAQGKGEIPLFDANSIVGYSSYALSSVPYLTIIKDGAGVGRIRKLPGNSAFLGTMTGLIPRNVDIDFIHSLISTLSLEKSFSGSTIPHIYFSDYGKLKIYIPDFSEQQKIGQFFSSIDYLIQSQKLKLKKLNEVKQSLLSKMFASENQKFPEIRFKGFKEEWIKEKIKELAIFRRGSFPQPYGEEKWYSGPGAMPFVQVADIGNALSLNKKTNQLISKIAMPFSVFVPKNSVIVTLQGTIGRVALTNYDCFIDRTILYFNSYRKLLNKILFAILIKNKFEQEVLLAPGAVIKTITKQKLNNFELFIPNFNEQQKIGYFFQT